jgi:hypothetical protein
MKKPKTVIYETPEQIEAIIEQREAAAALLPPGLGRQTVLMEVARLRSYASMKRLLSADA